MWRSAFSLVKHCRRRKGVGGFICEGGVGGGQKVASFPMFLRSNPSFRFMVANEFCVQPKTLINSDEDSKKDEQQCDNISFTEAKKIMRLVNVEALKTNLWTGGKDVIGYSELLQTCQSMGVARSPDEAASFVQSLDQAGVVLLFRDKVYLHPDKVVELVKKVVPLALNPEDDPSINELKSLEEKKVEIDRLAHRQVRYILSTGLGISVLQVGLFFRLTFWEFSWDVMEPIAFFTTATGIVAGYAYFLITSRDPTYEDFTKRLFLSRQRKLFKKHSFDVNRFNELKTKCKSSLNAPASIKDFLQPEHMVRLD